MLGFSIVIISKMEVIKKLRAETFGLRRSLDEMDEQAKLIVRTDLELNKTQEELDKKVSGLYTLQKILQDISTTLEENQIFRMIEPEYLKELGFEKGCAFLVSEETKKFRMCLNIGYSDEEMKAIDAFIAEEGGLLFRDLIKNNGILSSHLSDNNYPVIEKIKNIFRVDYFILAPILPKEGDKGFVFAGIEKKDTAMIEGDKELIIILANQIGQALENARLFEKTWEAQQSLERKVEERTRELRNALEEVKLMDRRKTDFVSAVSHELRTPLTSVKGYASILLTGQLGKVPEEVRLRIEKINRHSDELTHFVNDLLDISRIESGRIEMKKEPHQLKTIIDGVADLLGMQLKDHEIHLTVDIPADANHILADSGQIRRVFINLVSNALKFTPRQGRITITSAVKNDQIQVDVNDTGCGIPEEAQHSIFEEFYRVDNAINQEVKGTCLGLTLVKRIIEAHSGKIWVTSKVGQGATFSFLLPKTS
jgi:signal transduction histidine kinase